MTPGDDQEWLQWRREGITASDIAMAVSGRYGGAIRVVADKLGEHQRGEYTAQMERGHRWEDRIASGVELLTGLHVVGEQTWAQHGQRPEFRATLDGMAAPIQGPTIDDVTHLLEIKTRGINVKPAWDYWKPQTQWQMLVTGIDAAILAELVINDDEEFGDGIVFPDLRLHLVEADPVYQAELIDLADKLLAHVAAGTYPEPQHAGELDEVKALTLTVDPKADVVDLTDLADVVEEYHRLKAAAKAIEEPLKLAEAKIRTAIGDATKGTTATHTVGITKPRRVLTSEAEAALLKVRPDLAKTVLDKDRAKAEAKAIYEAAQQPLGARIITVKELT